jgi:hypothetical protein
MFPNADVFRAPMFFERRCFSSAKSDSDAARRVMEAIAALTAAIIIAA